MAAPPSGVRSALSHDEFTSDPGLTLLNEVQPVQIRSHIPGQHPEQHWNGRRETLGGWFAEFETVLSAVSPELYEFAVEYFLSDRNKTVIFVPGQAAQLDGVLPRPDYSWTSPAPSDPAQYAIPEAVIIAAYTRMHHERCLRDPNLDPTTPPSVPAGTTYPIDKERYVLSLAQLNHWNMRLRNAILRFISDLPTRHIFAKDYPRDGRALLSQLRNMASVPLSTTQVNSVLQDIELLITNGLKDDTVESFRELGVIYHRLLARIPDNDPSRDSLAQQATRYIKGVIKKRPHVGESLMHYFASHSINQQDPGSVRDAIINFLEEKRAVDRLCDLKQPTPSVPPPTLPDVNAIAKSFTSTSLLNRGSPISRNDPRKHSPTRNRRSDDRNKHSGDAPKRPCLHCGGAHFDRDCTDDKAGSQSFFKELVREHERSRARTRAAADDESAALINQAFNTWESTPSTTTSPRSYASVVIGQ